MRQIFVAIAATLIALGGAASAQVGGANAAVPQDVQQKHMQAFAVGDYLGALQVFEGLDPQNMEPALRSSWSQFRPVFDGFVVQSGMASSSANPLPDADLARLIAAQRKDAVAEIVQRARNTRIVIVNETHDNPRDRAFVMKVAEALRPLGYTHYAAETLANWGSPEQVSERSQKLMQRGYPVFQDGYYSKDPAFGALLRRVLALGYRPVSYEWTPGPEGVPSDMKRAVALREKGQAASLAAALAAAEPDAKFLIHVGYSHAAEVPLGEQPWMAAQLKEMTGVDPLTVDQTGMSQYLRPEVHARVAPEAGSPPVVLFDGQDPVRIGSNGQAWTFK